jgi:YbbR domain-containing protein
MKKILRKIFIQNWPLKLLALIIAVLLWFFITGSEISEYNYDVPVTFSNLPVEYIIIDGDKTHKIKITIKGTHLQAMNRSLDEFKIIKDLSNITTGIHDIRFYHQDIKYPNETELVSFEPRIITIEIDNREIKRVRFSTPVIKGTPAQGYEVTKIDLSDNYTQIEGAASALKNISILELEPIDISDISSSISKKVNILKPDNINITGVESVTVTVKVSKK